MGHAQTFAPETALWDLGLLHEDRARRPGGCGAVGALAAPRGPGEEAGWLRVGGSPGSPAGTGRGGGAAM